MSLERHEDRTLVSDGTDRHWRTCLIALIPPKEEADDNETDDSDEDRPYSFRLADGSCPPRGSVRWMLDDEVVPLLPTLRQVGGTTTTSVRRARFGAPRVFAVV